MKRATVHTCHGRAPSLAAPAVLGALLLVALDRPPARRSRRVEIPDSSPRLTELRYSHRENESTVAIIGVPMRYIGLRYN